MYYESSFLLMNRPQRLGQVATACYSSRRVPFALRSEECRSSARKRGRYQPLPLRPLDQLDETLPCESLDKVTSCCGLQL